MSEIKKIQDKLIIEVKVKPNSPEFKIERKNRSIIIYCKSSPEDNKANREIIKELKKLTNKEVRIVKGLTSKKKSIVIYNIGKGEFEKLIT